MKKIYIILTQSGTWLSRILRFVTKDPYNHSSICLYDDFHTFYSFGRKNPYFMLPAGFVEESSTKGVFARFSRIPCLVLEKEITEEQYDKLETIINDFKDNSADYSYAILSLFLANTKYSITNPHKFFCSQFVAKVLNDIDIPTSRTPEHMHPIYFTKIDGIKTVYEGNLKNLTK